MCVQKWMRCLLVVSLVALASLVAACGTIAPCDGQYSQLSFNPNGSQCERLCQCNNQAYEGICLEGRCRSRLRDACSIKDQIRGCKLLAPAEGTTCLDGTQACHPEGLSERRWGDCKPLENIAKEENTKALCLDRIDNDCDGKVDLEETACKDFCNRGDTRQCYTGKKGTLNVGRCAAGTQYCDPSTNQWFSTCESEVTPAAAEICNGVDDDCNGKIDEDLPKCLCREEQKGKKEPCFTGPVGAETFGICRSGRRECKQVEKGVYRWSKCENEVLPKKQEACNSLDDNCNGIIDEGCPCKEPLTRSCGHDIGECRQGEQRCIQGKWGRTCYAQVAPRGEQCDGRDNDCNGYIDDRLQRTCKSACGIGTETCNAGKWEGCDAPASAPETCNDKDDDCDGTVDNGLSRKCTTKCGDGVELCVKGKWSSCKASNPPAETCNNKDDDCDGLTDEGLARTCDSPCGSGVQLCTRGTWSKCATSNPPPETCNNKDDDCDGQTDENLIQTCKTPCGNSTQTCKEGKWSECSKPTTRPEVCNGVDDDCDGKIDGLPPRPCDTKKCLKGNQTCTNGAWTPCEKVVIAETCNGKDDNCNGQTDEGLTRQCAGLAKTTSCTKGRNFCINGSWTDPKGAYWGCVEVTNPEICDGKDNDCDGTVDGNKRPCQRGCNQGSEGCSAGKWGIGADACNAKAADPETCNNKDDDCDGDIDENVSRGCNDPAITEKCLQGRNVCLKGLWRDPQTKDYYGCIKVAPPEKCNNKDDDCDGSVDENLTQPCDASQCFQGTETCTNGNWDKSKCTKVIAPEVCNGKDDNCDGQVDEGNLRGCVTLLVGTPKQSGNTAGSASTSSFKSPHGIRFDPNGPNLWVMDTGNNAIREVVLDTNGNPTSTKVLAGSTTGASGTTNGKGTLARFNAPRAFGDSFDENGYVIIVDTGNHMLRSFEPSTGTVRTFSGAGAPPGHANGKPAVTKFHTPLSVFALSVSVQQDFLVADSLNHRIRLIKGGQATSPTYGDSSDYAGSGVVGFKDDTGTAATFNKPGYMGSGVNGTLVIDTGNHCIRNIVDGTKVVTTVAGKCGTSGVGDGDNTSARFNGPQGAAGSVLSVTGLLIADTENHCIRELRYDFATKIYSVSTFAGTCGTAGYRNGTPSQALFNRPTHIVENISGTVVYIVDSGNHVVRRIIR